MTQSQLAHYFYHFLRFPYFTGVCKEHKGVPVPRDYVSPDPHLYGTVGAGVTIGFYISSQVFISSVFPDSGCLDITHPIKWDSELPQDHLLGELSPGQDVILS